MDQQQAPTSDNEDGLLSRIGLIEAQPLESRATGYDQLAEELLAELQRGDQESSI